MRSITDVLTEFPRARQPVFFGLRDQRSVSEPPPSGVTTDQAVNEARQAGHDEGRAAAEDLCAERLAELTARHEAALDVARARWAADEGARLAESLAQGLSALEEGIATALSSVLVPLLTEAARARAAEEIGAMVADLIAGGQGELIEVRGPADLLGALRTRFAEQSAVAITEADEPEVSVRAGVTTIASQAGAWAGRLETALREVQP